MASCGLMTMNLDSILAKIKERTNAVMAPVFRCARSVPYAVLLTALIAIVGLLGSLYTQEIRDAFPFYWPWLRFGGDPYVQLVGPGLSWAAGAFWGILLLTALVFGVRQSAVDHDQRQAQAGLEGAVADLEKLIRTVPSPDFLAAFRDTYMLCDDATQSILAPERDAPGPLEIRMAIRQLLKAVAILAWRYDGQPAVDYGANVMLFRPREEIDSAEWPELRQRMPFDFAVDETDLRGVLELQVELSATDQTAPEDYDRALRPLAIAIPVRSQYHPAGEPKPRWRVLPGAPLAFIQRSADHYLDTSRLDKWCEQFGDFSLQQRGAVAEYFRPGPELRVGSMLSVAIGHGDEGPVLGVLNIHRSSSGLLKETESALQQFVPLLDPIVLMLARLLLELSPQENGRLEGRDET